MVAPGGIMGPVTTEDVKIILTSEIASGELPGGLDLLQGHDLRQRAKADDVHVVKAHARHKVTVDVRRDHVSLQMPG